MSIYRCLECDEYRDVDFHGCNRFDLSSILLVHEHGGFLGLYRRNNGNDLPISFADSEFSFLDS